MVSTCCETHPHAFHAFFYINLSAIFVILFSKKIAKLRLITLLFSILLIFEISLINPTAKERVFDTTIYQMNLTKNDKNEDQFYIFSKQHNAHYVTAYKIFLDNSIIDKFIVILGILGLPNLSVITNFGGFLISVSLLYFFDPKKIEA